jgi:hypothetical protein
LDTKWLISEVFFEENNIKLKTNSGKIITIPFSNIQNVKPFEDRGVAGIITDPEENTFRLYQNRQSVWEHTGFPINNKIKSLLKDRAKIILKSD